MNKFLLSTALAGLLSASIFAPGAFAQGEHHDAGHGGGAPHAQGGGAPHGGPAMHAGGLGGAPHPVPDAAGHGYHTGGAPGGAPAMQMHHDSHGGGPRPGGAMTGPGPGAAMHGPGPGAEMHGGHAGDFSAYHRNFTAPRHFHGGAYNRPSGWYAHRWTYGEILPSLFWQQNYWIGDFDNYGLMPPPPGTVWVRDGADALLIDQDSGEVIQVEYGVFD